MIALVIWSANISKDHSLKQNLYRSSILCTIFLALVGFNSAVRQPYITAGTAPQFMRGIIMFYCCVLIFVLSNNYEDAREIVSVFEAKPTQEKLDA